ncbi:TRAP transporter small permease [Oceanibacterium hippocampi]|uniref:TRAP transporter small permease protein n=1 Tax=Oceanibacterium hippocampi TaxID=745714 RepID=A0A1Y5SXP1_9PROT|nr:TRAP transporter small permease subunit [Oceanibacterium hippocampi]SLN47539.1 Tripartite ATP-independent periplasmic transporters, DctQ component [Oceanibacterium hippocampi]
MHAALNILSAVNNRLAQVIVIVAALIVLVIVAVVFGGVAIRTVTGHGSAMVQELPPLLVPWLVFPLLGLLLRSDSHIAIDFLPAILPDRSKRMLRIAVALVSLIAGAIFCQAGLEAVSLFQMTGQVTEMELEFPIWWIYLSFPVGFAILMSFALEVALAAFLGKPGTGDAAPAHNPEL